MHYQVQSPIHISERNSTLTQIYIRKFEVMEELRKKFGVMEELRQNFQVNLILEQYLPPHGELPPVVNLAPLVKPIQVNGHWGDIMSIIAMDPPEDSIWRKLAACIPVIGYYFSITNQRSLSEKITTWKGNETKAQLIFVKNHYKYATIVRNALTVAAVAGLGFSTAVPAVAALAVSSSVYNVYAIVKNRQLANELSASHDPIENLHNRLK